MKLFPLGGFEVTYPTGTPLPYRYCTLELLPVDVSYRMHSTREGTGTPRPGYLCPDLNLANSGTIPDWPPLGTPCSNPQGGGEKMKGGGEKMMDMD